jgi:hypothetical protein
MAACSSDSLQSSISNMPTPSLILVPARFKTGKLYTPVATTSGGLVLGASGDFNVTRATTATRVNESGLIESVASGIPRLDYPLGGGCPALLVEPSGSNLAFHSETWASGNNWTLDAVTRVTGSTSAFLAPDGTFTANALSPTSANVFHGLYSNSSTQNTYISGTIYTQSAFFKQGTGVAGRYVQLTYTGGGQFTQNGYANFDLQLGTVAVVSGTSADTNRAARIENYGNGWYRCSFTATCNAAGNGIGVLPVLVNASGNTRAQSFAGVTGDILYGWGAQLETGSVATSYIPTTTAAVTRNADVINLSGAVSGCIGQTEGTIYAEVVLSRINANYIISLGTLNDRIMINFDSSTSVYALIRVGGVNADYTATIPAIPATGGVYKIALAYKANDYCFAVNGVAYPSTASRGIPATMSAVYLGASVFSTAQLNDRIRAAALYTTRLTNAELAALTTL